MHYIRYFLISSSILLLSYYGYAYFSIHEEQIKKAASSGVLAKFIKVDEKTLSVVQEHLAKLKPLPKEVLEEAPAENFGRKTLFLPE